MATHTTTHVKDQGQRATTPGRADGGPDKGRDDDFARLREQLNAAPVGYDATGADIEKFWSPELSPIHCVPLSVRVFDNSTEPQKVSCLIAVKLLAPCGVVARREEGEEKPKASIAREGEVIGVWYRPGMRGIRELGGAPTWIKVGGLKKIPKKPQPMQLFEVRGKVAAGKRLEITEDTRDKSRNAPTPFDAARPAEDEDNVTY